MKTYKIETVNVIPLDAALAPTFLEAVRIWRATDGIVFPGLRAARDLYEAASVLRNV